MFPHASDGNSVSDSQLENVKRIRDTGCLSLSRTYISNLYLHGFNCHDRTRAEVLGETEVVDYNKER